MDRNPRTADRHARHFDSFRPRDDSDDEFDPLFDDFLESITLTREELAVFVAMPEASVPEVKRMFDVPLFRGERPHHA